MLAALILLLLAGGMNGSFATPMKRVRGWEWENTWLVWAFLGMIVIPLAVAAVTVPNLKAVYSAVSSVLIARIAVYGSLWGVSAVLFGLGIARVGIALGFGMILGTSSSLGAIVPFVRLHRDRLFTTVGLLTLAGVGVILAGVVACARAGLLREAAGTQARGAGSFNVGLLICVLSGIGSAFMSLALNEATPISKAAEALGTPTSRSLNAVWPVLLGGGFTVNAAYCAFRLIRRSTVGRFRHAIAANLTLVLAMAVLWSGSNFVYGAGARGMGPLGLVLGWPVFMAAIVLTANAWGLVTGEWRGSGWRTAAWAVAGSLLLVAGISVIASAGRAS
jgi:L-rhamnose-H+ transport protein